MVEQGFDADTAELDDVPREAAEAALRQLFDGQDGGFGPPPKFPQPVALRWLLGRWRRSGQDALLDMITTTLDHMAAGGLFDHLGGGFHRYSVDGAGWCRTSKKCSTTMPRWRSAISRPASHRQAALCRGGATNARLSAPRHDRPAGRHL